MAAKQPSNITWFPKFTYDRILKHTDGSGKSFLSDPKLVDALTKFLTKEYSAENLEFLIKMIEINEGIKNGAIDKNNAEIQLMDVYKTFVEPKARDEKNREIDGTGAPKQTNLTDQQIKLWQEWAAQPTPRSFVIIEKDKKTNMETIINRFESSVKNIEALMNSDSKPRFLRSKEYQSYLDHLKKHPNHNSSNPMQYFKNALGSENITDYLVRVGSRPFSSSGIDILAIDNMTERTKGFSKNVGTSLVQGSYSLESTTKVNNIFQIMDEEIMSTPDWKTFWKAQLTKLQDAALEQNNKAPLTKEQQAKIQAEIVTAQTDVLFGYRFRAIEARTMQSAMYAKTLPDKDKVTFLKESKEELLMLKELNLHRKNAQQAQSLQNAPNINIQPEEVLIRTQNAVKNDVRASIQGAIIERMKLNRVDPKGSILSIDNIIIGTNGVKDLKDSLGLDEEKAKAEMKEIIKAQIQSILKTIVAHMPDDRYLSKTKYNLINHLNLMMNNSKDFKAEKLTRLLIELPQDLKDKITEGIKSSLEQTNREEATMAVNVGIQAALAEAFRDTEAAIDDPDMTTDVPATNPVPDKNESDDNIDSLREKAKRDIAKAQSAKTKVGAPPKVPKADQPLVAAAGPDGKAGTEAAVTSDPPIIDSNPQTKKRGPSGSRAG